MARNVSQFDWILLQIHGIIMSMIYDLEWYLPEVVYVFVIVSAYNFYVWVAIVVHLHYQTIWTSIMFSIVM